MKRHQSRGSRALTVMDAPAAAATERWLWLSPRSPPPLGSQADLRAHLYGGARGGGVVIKPVLQGRAEGVRCHTGCFDTHAGPPFLSRLSLQKRKEEGRLSSR